MLILNNSVISAFCEMKRLQLLKQIIRSLKEKAAVPKAVRLEITYDEALHTIYIHKKEFDEKWILLLDHEDVKEYASRRGIHEGEAAVITLSKKYDATAVLDDFKAREVAREEQVKLTGTLGLLRVGYEECPIHTKNELAGIIRELRRIHFYLPEDAEEYLLEAEKEDMPRP